MQPIIGGLIIIVAIGFLFKPSPLPGSYTPNIPNPPCAQCIPSREEAPLTGRHQARSRGVDVDWQGDTYQSYPSRSRLRLPGLQESMQESKKVKVRR